MGHPSPSPPLEALLTVPQVAASLQMSPRTVYRLIKSHRLPGTYIGRTVRVKQTDLKRFLTQGVSS